MNDDELTASDDGGDVATDTGGDVDPAAAMNERLSGAFDAEVADDATYRDVKGVRDDVAKARDAYKPYAEAFGGLDDAARAELLEVAPNLGGDLGVIGKAFAGLHPDDRKALAGIIQGISTDPVAAAQQLQQAAAQIEQAFGGGADDAGDEDDDEYDPADELAELESYDDDEADDDPMAAPMTRADFAQMMEQAAYDQTVTNMEQTILTELRELGYDADSNDPVERARATALLELARTSDEDLPVALRQAHEAIEGWEQQVIDQYASGKRADARRPQPPGGGAPASGERVLESLGDAREAMNARLDGVLGAGRRR